MTRRILGSATGSVCGLLLLASLVVGGLGWVSVASLRVEESQRRSAVEARAANRERLALWRLDSHMLSPLGLESNRPYSHYSALHAPSAIVLDESGAPAVDPGRVPSPLLGADLPDWVKLHVQIDPNRGWQSPQVIAAQLAERLAAGPLELNLSNVTPERAASLEELRLRFPTAALLRMLAERDRIRPVEEAYIVPVPLADEPSTEKPAPSRDDAVGLMRESGESWLVTEAVKDHLERFQAKLGGNFRKALYSDPSDGVEFGRNAGKPEANGAAKGAEDRRAPGLPADQVYPPLAQEPLTPVQALPKPRELSNAELDRDAAARQLTVNKAMTQRGGYDVGAGRSMNNAVGNVATGPGAAKAGGRDSKPTKEAVPPLLLGLEQQTKQWIDNLTNSIQNRAKEEVSKNYGFKPDGKKHELSDPKAPAPGMPQSGRKPTIRRNGDDRLAQAKPDDLRERPRADLAEAKPGPIVAPVAVHIGPMRPRWIADVSGAPHLFLLRSVRLGASAVYQGVAVDWPKLRAALKAELTDLFPAAELFPLVADEAAHERTMTALPVRLDPGTDTAPVPDGWSPLRTGLVIAWAAALLAIGAVAFGARAVLQMAERRIRFASAVTHELRTPLTAMQLHLDLLNSGLVSDETKRAEFLTTICSEAQRLNQLVENVLDFARLENRSARASAQSIPVDATLETVRQTWAERLRGEGFELVFASEVAPGREVRIDPRVLEQVLGNLIDNARKYAKSATDRRIWLRIKPVSSDRLAIEVEDRGPGVPTSEQRQIFQPFRRGIASTDTGGAGLGLSLAKQWAELFGGTLSYRAAEGGTGACFRLELAA